MLERQSSLNQNLAAHLSQDTECTHPNNNTPVSQVCWSGYIASIDETEASGEHQRVPTQHTRTLVTLCSIGDCRHGFNNTNYNQWTQKAPALRPVHHNCLTRWQCQQMRVDRLSEESGAAQPSLAQPER